jgi:hypothetical protein
LVRDTLVYAEMVPELRKRRSQKRSYALHVIDADLATFFLYIWRLSLKLGLKPVMWRANRYKNQPGLNPQRRLITKRRPFQSGPKLETLRQLNKKWSDPVTAVLTQSSADPSNLVFRVEETSLYKPNPVSTLKDDS